MRDFPIPKILQAFRFIEKADYRQMRRVNDYEFDFYVGGERKMEIDGVSYKISKGCLVFRKPGQLVVGQGDYNMYALTIDFSKKCPISPDKYYRNSQTPQQEKCEYDVLDIIPPVFIPYNQEEILRLYKGMVSCSYPNNINLELQEKYIKEFLFLVIYNALRYQRESFEANIGEKGYVEKACEYIDRNFQNEISVDDIAKHVMLNKNYLIRLFKKEIMTTPNKYVLERRLLYAEIVLIQTQLSVENIAVSSGFKTPSYFIKCFKNRFGESPMIYRNKIRTSKGGIYEL